MENLISGKVVYELYSVHGVPLDIVVETMRDHGITIQWLDFYNVAVTDGWNPYSTIAKIENTVLYVMGPEYTEEFMRRLKWCIVKEYENIT